MGKKIIAVRAKERGYNLDFKTCDLIRQYVQKTLGEKYIVIVLPYSIYSPDGSAPMITLDDKTFSYKEVIEKLKN